MNAMTLFAADWNVIDNIRIKHLQRLHEQRRGSLSVYIEVAPDADEFVVEQRLANPCDRWFNVREGRGGKLIGMQKGAGGVGSQNPAADESLRDEGMQAQG